MSLILEYSNFEMYLNANILNECSPIIYDARMPKRSFLSSFNQIVFRQVFYPKSVCPLIFRKTFLTEIFFTDMTNSFLVKKRLRFFSMNQTFGVKMSKNLYFELHYEQFSFGLFSIQPFQSVEYLTIVGILNNVEDDLFKELTKLRGITLRIDNLKEFFHNGNKWMAYLNNHVQLRHNNKLEIQANIKSNKHTMLVILSAKLSESFFNVYRYPDEDLCLFKAFPHEHLVFPLIYPEERLECTCLLKWLNYHYNDLKVCYKKDDLESIDFYKISDSENLTIIV